MFPRGLRPFEQAVREQAVTRGFANDFRRFFFRGLTVVLPTLLTLAIIVWVFTMIQTYVGEYINTGVQWVVVQYGEVLGHSHSGSPAALPGSQPGPKTPWRPLVGSDQEWDRVKGYWRTYHLSWLGFVLAFVAIYMLGRFVASFLGRGIWRMLEMAFLKLPVVKQIYPYVKQVTDFLFSEHKIEFSRVVAVEYPRKGAWSVGLVTGPGLRTLQGAAGGDFLSIFVASTPTPVTGYTIIVRRDEVIDLPMSIDEAIRFIISGGVIVPQHQQLSQTETEQARQGALVALSGKETPE